MRNSVLKASSSPCVAGGGRSGADRVEGILDDGLQSLRRGLTNFKSTLSSGGVILLEHDSDGQLQDLTPCCHVVPHKVPQFWRYFATDD